MNIKMLILLLGTITTVSINCSIAEKIDASKKEIAEMRKKAIKNETVNVQSGCGYNDCSCG